MPVRYALACLLLLPACALLRTGPPKPAPEFVPIPGGTFVMGVDDEEDEYAYPPHRVTVEPFALMRREVTYAEFDQFATAQGLAFPDDDGFVRGDRAVVFVTWDEAVAFCEWIGARLPTEAEWEWAARSGDLAQRYAGTDSLDTLAPFAWFEEDEGLFGTTPARRRPNPFGLVDMSGNAFEWIGAFYERYPEPSTEPAWFDFESRPLRMIRGGSYRSPERQLLTYVRASTLADVRSDHIGFRCAR